MKKILFAAAIILIIQCIPLNSALADENSDTAPETAYEAGNNENDDKVPVMSENEKKNEVFLLQIRQQLQNARNDY